MGVNFTAMFGHQLSFDEIIRFKEYISTTISITDREWSWTQYRPYKSLLEQYNNENYLILEGSGDFNLYFGRHLCQLYHTARWKLFLSSSDIRNSIRHLCFKLYPILGEAIYVPDEYCIDGLLNEGKRLEDVRTELYTKFGEPTESFEELLWKYENEKVNWGYYVESFKDIICK